MGYIQVVADDARAELPSTSSGSAQSQEFGARQETETSTMKRRRKSGDYQECDEESDEGGAATKEVQGD